VPALALASLLVGAVAASVVVPGSPVDALVGSPVAAAPLDVPVVSPELASVGSPQPASSTTSMSPHGLPFASRFARFMAVAHTTSAPLRGDRTADHDSGPSIAPRRSSNARFAAWYSSRVPSPTGA